MLPVGKVYFIAIKPRQQEQPKELVSNYVDLNGKVLSIGKLTNNYRANRLDVPSVSRRWTVWPH